MRVNEYCQDNGISEVKLHLGCGGVNLSGWVNIDNYDYDERDTSRHGSNYDLKMDIRSLDVEDDSVDEILMIHVLEHFVRWEAIDMLEMFFFKLKSGGRLKIEMPDLDKCIEWYLKGKDAKHIETPIGSLNMGFTQFYGNQWNRLDFETHRYVWTKNEFRDVLENIGFFVREITNGKSTHEVGRDMYVEAEKR